jgi:hypothetical protein
MVTDLNGDPVPNATITLLDVPVDPVQTNENGEYIFPAIPGDYDYVMKVDGPGYDNVIREVSLPVDGTTEDFLVYGYIGFEADNGGFSGEGDWEWGTPTEAGGPPQVYDGENAWGTNLDGAFEGNSKRNLITGEYYIEGTADGDAHLEFHHIVEVDEGYDGGNVAISTDGGANWTVIDPEGGYPNSTIIGLIGDDTMRGYSTETDNWVEAIFDLTDYIGETVSFRFRFGSTNNTDYRGWFIDHFVIYGAFIEPEMDPAFVDAPDIDHTPAHYALSQNYPNPFNPTTEIHYTIPTNTTVDLFIYDVSGKLVRTLVSEEQSEGYYSVTWNGKDDHGETVSSGVYLYHIQAGEYTKTRQCLLLK